MQTDPILRGIVFYGRNVRKIVLKSLRIKIPGGWWILRPLEPEGPWGKIRLVAGGAAYNNENEQGTEAAWSRRIPT